MVCNVLVQGSARERERLRATLEASAEGDLRVLDGERDADCLARCRGELGPLPDVLVLAHEPPRNDALRLLETLRRARVHAPSVVVCPEERALERSLLRAGASELVSRERVSPATLACAVDRALVRSELRPERSWPGAGATDGTRAEELRHLFATSLLGVLHFSMDGGVHDANDEFLRIVGYERDDLREGRIDWTSMTPPEYHAQDERAVEALRRTGMHPPIEKQYVRKDGSRVWILVGSTLIDRQSGIGIGFVLDIDARKQSEQERDRLLAELRATAEDAEQHKAQLEAVIEAMADGVVVFDLEGNVLVLNEAEAQINGFPNAASMKQSLAFFADIYELSSEQGQLVDPSDWPVARVLRGETLTNVQLHTRRTDTGQEWEISFSGAPIFDRSGRLVLAVIVTRDITSQKQSDAALRESEQRFSTLANHVAQLAWMADGTGSIFWYNRRWHEYTGTTFEQMRREGFGSVLPPEHLERVTRKVAARLASGEAWEDTFPIRGADGTYRWFLSQAMPVEDEQGNVIRWLGTSTDIEEQRQQAAALEEAIRVRDAFVQVAAHELRTPLTALSLQLEGLRRTMSGGGEPLDVPRSIKKVDLAVRQTRRLGALIEALLDVSRIRSGDLKLAPETLDFAALVRDTVEGTMEMAARAECELRLSVQGPLIGYWDRARLEQAVSNLLTNAIKYGAGAPIDVALARASGRAELRIRDHGIGIAEVDQLRIFERFERAVPSSHYGGLGLGLYVTREIARAHGGTVEVESAPHAGATFILRLPIEPCASALI